MNSSQSRPIIQLTFRGFLPGGWRAGTPTRARGLLARGLPLFLIIFTFTFQTARAQDAHKRKVPIVDKLSGGDRQAFSGKVETLDLKHHVLELNARESKSLEIFPVKKGVSVTSADGGRMRLEQLKPGNEVIIYYEQKGDRRTINDIVLLTEGTADKPKKSAPPS